MEPIPLISVTDTFLPAQQASRNVHYVLLRRDEPDRVLSAGLHAAWA